MAGDMVNQNQAEQLYDATAQTAYQQAFMREINPRWSGTCLYLNPPHYAWLMSWITDCGYGTALITWWTLSLIAFAATAYIWRIWLSPRAGLAIILALCLPAWFWAFAGGQNSFFSLLILTGFCGLLLANRDLAAGLVLSLLAFKFQLLILPAGLLLVKRRWRAVAGLMTGGILTMIFTAATSGFDAIYDYAHFGASLGQLMQLDGFDVHKQHSWHGFFALLGSGWLSVETIRAATLVASLATVAWLALLWRGPWHANRPRFALQLAALMIATVLTSPHLFQYDMLVITLPAILWYVAAQEQRVADATPTIPTLLAVGFVWLAVSGFVAAVLPVQLSAPLMLTWLLLLRRPLQACQESASPAAGPCATAL
jgi:hypothetical protein